jgi:hypothetical protein
MEEAECFSNGGVRLPRHMSDHLFTQFVADGP